ncbi:MAG TPA: glycosyltransferase, partial [Chitinophagaceae bacterium]|nr:glycosyltransferase [Chitinophagaceae bacterium]
VEIIRSFNDSRIRLYINEKNEGIPATLNKGIALANYELIARMDGDDICHPLRLEKQVGYMESHPECAMVSSWVRLIDGLGSFIRVEGTKSKYLYYNLFFECCIFHPTVMFRKEMLIKAGNYQFPFAEDYELFRRISRHFEIGGIDEPLLDYRVHGSNTHLVKKKAEYMDFTEKVLRDNIGFCLGEDLRLPLSYLNCYRYDYDMLLREKNRRSIYDCLRVLDRISKAIINIPNPNTRKEDIQYMMLYKKDYILNHLAKHLPVTERLFMAFKFKNWNLLPHFSGKIKIPLSGRFKKAFSGPHP